ncbi:preATP grasp domain-containing protein [Actinokineospora sp. NPDC004072]
MARLVVGNYAIERALPGLAPDTRRTAGIQGQRMLWSAAAGDGLLLARHPDEDFLRYACGLLGMDRDALRVVVPPPGHLGADVLTTDRVTAEPFLGSLRELGVEGVLPYSFDELASRLVTRLGLAGAVPGFGFIDQGGGDLLNSKVVFRAVAAGIGLPIPDGIVTDQADEALAFAWPLLADGRMVIVKQDVHVGGLGNEILRPDESGADQIGALTTVRVADRAALAEHLRASWHRYSGGSRSRVVVEHYEPDSLPIWAEVEVGAEAATLVADGVMRMKPIINGVIIPIPPPTSQLAAFPGFQAHAIALGEAMRAMGYRGITNIDAMVTPDGRILFNEWNARLGGCSHLYRIGERVLGGDYLADRCMVERRGCPFPAFDATLAKLVDSGLAYDQRTRTGVLVSVFGDTGGEATIIGADVAETEALERELVALFPAEGADD